MGVSCIVVYIVGANSRYKLSNHCKSDPCVRIQYDISDSQLALELSPEEMTSTLTFWRTLHTAGAYSYHIQRIRHLEPTDTCNRWELRCWINFNPIWFVIFFVDEAEHARRTATAKSQRCKKNQQRCSASYGYKFSGHTSLKMYPSRRRTLRTVCLSVERWICSCTFNKISQ
jgi:hypothetical protein